MVRVQPGEYDKALLMRGFFPEEPPPPAPLLATPPRLDEASLVPDVERANRVKRLLEHEKGAFGCRYQGCR